MFFAVFMGMAKPMPAVVPVGVYIALLMPITSP